MPRLRVSLCALLGATLAGCAERDSTARPAEGESATAAPASASSSDRLIAGDSVGPLRLGMTVVEARRALPGFALTRTTDGDGVALVAAMRGNETVMTLYAGEEDPEQRIDERATIQSIEVWDSTYRTQSGVHPRMPVRDVESKYGALREITVSEIESREYASFASQPDGILLRISNAQGMAGRYAERQRTTTRYDPSAYVLSISISHR